MPGGLHTRRTEAGFGLLVVAGVTLAGIYDVAVGEPPSGLLGLGRDVGVAAFLISCASAAVVMVVLARGDGTLAAPDPIRRSLMLMCLGPAVFADPTYGSLLMAVPLIDVRRREDEPLRSILTVSILCVVAAIVLAEDTRRTTTEFEAMMTLAIGFMAMGVLGDALRRLDVGLELERRLAAMDERNRLAEELHDSLGHHLLATSVQLQAATAFRSRDADRAETAIEHASTAVARAIAETRLIVDASRGDERFDIEPSIRELAQRILPTGTTMDIRIEGDHAELPPATRVAVYRVVQEALANLVRHSGATAASVRSSTSNDAVTIQVVDNGTGFDAAARADAGGLANMRRRVEELGGVFGIESGLGGTTVIATVPR